MAEANSTTSPKKGTRVRIADDASERGPLLGVSPKVKKTEFGAMTPQEFEEQTLNTSTNVILLYRLNHLQAMSNANLVLAIMALLYAATNVVLLVLNVADHNDDDCGDPKDLSIARCGSATSDLIFHRLEFWATFCFALVTAFSLMYTPKAVQHIYNKPLVLKLVLLVEICFAAVPAALVTINLQIYEFPCHEIEYVNELTVSFVDFILLASLLRLPEDEEALEDDLEEEDMEQGAFHPGNFQKGPRRYSVASTALQSKLSTVSDAPTTSDASSSARGGGQQREGSGDTLNTDTEDPDEYVHPASSLVSNMKTTGFFPPSRQTSAASGWHSNAGASPHPAAISPFAEPADVQPKSVHAYAPEIQRAIPLVAMSVACIQLVIYNSFPWFKNSERTAHFFEFTFGIISSFITFWFCMDNRFEAAKEIMLILYGNHRDCGPTCQRPPMKRQSIYGPNNGNNFVMSVRRKFARTFSTVSNNRRLSTFELAHQNNPIPQNPNRRASTAVPSYHYDACGTRHNHSHTPPLI